MTWRIGAVRTPPSLVAANQVGEALAATTGRPWEVVPAPGPDGGSDATTRVEFVRRAVLAGSCDLAVHAHDELPCQPVAGLVIAAVPRRVDPRDVLVTRDGARLADLPNGLPVTIGANSSLRRAQLQRARRNAVVQPLSAGLDNSLARLVDGSLDAVVVAGAQLLRTAQAVVGILAVPLEHGELLHAPAQGALALECRSDDDDTRLALATLDRRWTRLLVTVERQLLLDLGGDPTAAVGAHARLVDGPRGPLIELLGLLSDKSGTRMARTSQRGAPTEANELSAAVASSLRSATGLDQTVATAP